MSISQKKLLTSQNLSNLLDPHIRLLCTDLANCNQFEYLKKVEFQDRLICFITKDLENQSREFRLKEIYSDFLDGKYDENILSHT